MFSSVKGFGADDLTLTYHFHAGKHLGYEFVRKGIIKTIDDLFPVLVKYRIGLIDIVRESSNTMVLDVYECMSCSGLPNIGRPVCYFESGIVSAILEK